MKEIYVTLKDHHFDLITTMTGFLGLSYYCHECDKGYAVREQHYCTSV